MSFELETWTPAGGVSPAPATGTQTGARRAETVVREIVRSRALPSRVEISEDAAVALVLAGPRSAARSAGVCERTLRRHFVREGSTITEFTADVRLQAARELFSLGWDTEGAAEALGYGSAASFRRFLRRNSGGGTWSFRKRAEERAL